jgi:2-oxoglutarate ferredoxin oxidoreductase subunit delta
MSKTAHTTVPEFSLDRCKRCGICSHFCPPGAITADADGKPRLTDPEACTSCRLCEQLCPDFAIEMVPVRRR